MAPKNPNFNRFMAPFIQQAWDEAWDRKLDLSVVMWPLFSVFLQQHVKLMESMPKCQRHFASFWNSWFYDFYLISGRRSTLSTHIFCCGRHLSNPMHGFWILQSVQKQMCTLPVFSIFDQVLPELQNNTTVQLKIICILPLLVMLHVVLPTRKSAAFGQVSLVHVGPE